MSNSDHAGKRSQARKISVYILAANRLLREALAHAFKIRADIEVAGSNEEPHVSLSTIAELRPDVLLIDGSSPELDWGRFIPGVRQALPESRVVLFGMPENLETFFASIRAGAVGYVLNEASTSDLVMAVRLAACGGALCPPRLCLALFNYVARQAFLPSATLQARHRLTRREQQLLPLISQGLTNKEIAARLILSEQTVKNHVNRILRKMGAHDRLSAAHAAAASGCQL
jgi:two-component system response regulator DegU